jgi:hypothetical protein
MIIKTYIMKKITFLLLVFFALNLYSQDEAAPDLLFGKSFSYEKVESYEGCSEKRALSDKSVMRLDIKIDNKGNVTGKYGYIPCLESDSSYDVVIGFASHNLISVLWRDYDAGSPFIEQIFILIKNNNAFVFADPTGLYQVGNTVKNLSVNRSKPIQTTKLIKLPEKMRR